MTDCDLIVILQQDAHNEHKDLLRRTSVVNSELLLVPHLGRTIMSDKF